MNNYKAKGIVLHSVKYGESSMIVYMLTDTCGRQTYMVQGIRSGKSKGNKAALFQPMFMLEFVGLESPKMEMHRLKDIRPALPLATGPCDIRKSTISLFMAEVLYRLVREVEPESPLFDFVCGSVEALDGLQEGIANFHLWFLVRLSYYLGFYPGNEYTHGSWFDIREGVFTPVMPSHRMMFDRDNAGIMNSFMEYDVKDIAGIKLSRERRSSFMSAILAYFDYHLDSVNQIRSVQILKEVF